MRRRVKPDEEGGDSQPSPTEVDVNKPIAVTQPVVVTRPPSPKKTKKEQKPRKKTLKSQENKVTKSSSSNIIQPQDHPALSISPSDSLQSQSIPNSLSSQDFWNEPLELFPYSTLTETSSAISLDSIDLEVPRLSLDLMSVQTTLEAQYSAPLKPQMLVNNKPQKRSANKIHSPSIIRKKKRTKQNPATAPNQGLTTQPPLSLSQASYNPPQTPEKAKSDMNKYFPQSPIVDSRLGEHSFHSRA